MVLLHPNKIPIQCLSLLNKNLNTLQQALLQLNWDMNTHVLLKIQSQMMLLNTLIQDAQLTV